MACLVWASWLIVLLLFFFFFLLLLFLLLLFLCLAAIFGSKALVDDLLIGGPVREGPLAQQQYHIVSVQDLLPQQRLGDLLQLHTHI